MQATRRARSLTQVHRTDRSQSRDAAGLRTRRQAHPVFVTLLPVGRKRRYFIWGRRVSIRPRAERGRRLCLTVFVFDEHKRLVFADPSRAERTSSDPARTTYRLKPFGVAEGEPKPENDASVGKP